MIHSRNVVRAMVLVSTLVALSACGDDTPQALGTLEYDRITLPAPAAERIVAIDVHEGERVRAGQSLLRLEVTRTQAATQAVEAEAQRQREVLQELEAGPRMESIAQARAHGVDAADLARRLKERKRTLQRRAAELRPTRAISLNLDLDTFTDLEGRMARNSGSGERERDERGFLVTTNGAGAIAAGDAPP